MITFHHEIVFIYQRKNSLTRIWTQGLPITRHQLYHPSFLTRSWSSFTLYSWSIQVFFKKILFHCKWDLHLRNSIHIMFLDKWDWIMSKLVICIFMNGYVLWLGGKGMTTRSYSPRLSVTYIWMLYVHIKGHLTPWVNPLVIKCDLPHLSFSNT